LKPQREAERDQAPWVTADSEPPVYILHGFPETWFGGCKQIGFLSDSFTVVALDLRGYGASGKPLSGYDKRTMAPDVLALMDHLGHKRLALVGHDRSARGATRFAKDHSAWVVAPDLLLAVARQPGGGP
jgi:haloacetate dehalogenase